MGLRPPKHEKQNIFIAIAIYLNPLTFAANGSISRCYRSPRSASGNSTFHYTKPILTSLMSEFWQFVFVALSPVEYLTVENSTLTTFEKTRITINWDFSHTSKQIYSQLKYKKEVFKKFQGLSRFLRKMNLYSSAKFGILKPWTNIPWSRRFDLGFWQTSKQLYGKLQYKEEVFREFEASSHFPRKMALYSSPKFRILKPWLNIQSLRWFDLGQ